MLPLEIKSGKTYTRHNALDNVLKDERYAIPQALVLLIHQLYHGLYLCGLFLADSIDGAFDQLRGLPGSLGGLFRQILE